MTHAFDFAGLRLLARPAGTLLCPATHSLIVADLHLGKGARMARRGGALLPPWGDDDTLTRLQAEIEATRPARVISLGDAFDDDATDTLTESAARMLASLGARAEWLWVTGNHDAGARPGFGTIVEQADLSGVALRHIAQPGQGPDISGHYHPKATLAGRSRPCFVLGARHVVMPAFGQFTGGLDIGAGPLQALGSGGIAVLTGARLMARPIP